MPRALIIQHAAPETLGENFANLLEQQGFRLETLNLFAQAPDYAGFPAPPLSDIDLLIPLGGPLSANDDLPALHQERAYLQAAAGQNKPIFAVCLGAQLLATALGGIVEPTGGYQFGLRKIAVTAAGYADPVFGKITIPLVPTLHGDCFSLPTGATKLAEGYILCRDGTYRKINMAFRRGNAYAFQFEPQLTLPQLQLWNRELFADYQLMGANFDPQEEAARHWQEFTRYEPLYTAQMGAMLLAFLKETGLTAAAG